MALQRKWMPSPNYSSRGGQRVRLIVLHTAEGSRTIESLGSWFANASNQVSSHTGIDDQPGVIGEYVKRDGNAWTSASANPYSVQTELCGFASWDAAEWQRHPVMLQNCAAWIAEEAAFYGIPIVKLSAAQAQGGASGVCQHNDLGASGGGHWDCGPNFPIDQVLAMASGASSGPEPKKGTYMWTMRDKTSGGTWVADETGAVFAYDGAPYLGGANVYNDGGWSCSGLAEFSDPQGEGYLVTLDAGADAKGDRFLRYRFPRDGSAAKK
jgi:hypothetical protein